MPEIKFCRDCGAPYEAKALYCDACGKILAK